MYIYIYTYIHIYIYICIICIYIYIYREREMLERERVYILHCVMLQYHRALSLRYITLFCIGMNISTEGDI